ncbi:hypothetical protein SDC9_194689 [bioreactor metagenome]|uniref:Uncharacterized protein n=1 Tax=bioreactor metagenome TaxID=1076179 RepID=A0A645I9I9_9ZZZZ
MRYHLWIAPFSQTEPRQVGKSTCGAVSGVPVASYSIKTSFGPPLRDVFVRRARLLTPAGGSLCVAARITSSLHRVCI